MKKKQTMVVVCGNPPSPELSRYIARAEGVGFNVVVIDPSDSHSDRLKGHEVDYVTYNEACPVRCESEALDRLLKIGGQCKLISNQIESRDSRERTSLSKYFRKRKK